MAKTWLRVLIAIMFVAILFHIYLMDPFRSPKREQAPQVIAHRGASGDYPENTWPAFFRAQQLEVDWIELDIHFSKDSIPVVIHDATLDRTTNGSGPVRAFRWEEMNHLDAGAWKDTAFLGTRLMSLDQVLDRVSGRTRILIEIKTDQNGDEYPECGKVLKKLVEKYDASSWVSIQSFDSKTLSLCQKEIPNLTYQKLIVVNLPILNVFFDEKWQKDLSTHFSWVTGINPYFKLLNQRFINDMHANDLHVYSYTIDDESEMKKCIEWGVDGIITNYPDRLLKLLKD
ncbi:glycerophosphodiester phosphodiesterase family protein [Pontibacter sp. G13]|uniref:glycerophosphodiester phosphodiesterase n=1 Tax=Pontibacter sp. G13 TaxID=3074898 RepID=UPI00288C04B1|nr:glycerophosphodiester phosphodiesterase family protein [Pontibacter sp. G13]WNJ15923.1 glycerophosphodiester phosphodiesterase family protein [Pontibacter sp. G13]